MMALRNYVTARDEEAFDLLPENVVSLNITHSNLSQQHIEIKFDKHSTILEVKTRIRVHCGTPPQHQVLYLRSAGQTIANLDDDSRKLGYYSPSHGMVIHVVDTDPHSLSKDGGLEDVSQVRKYRMTEDDYDKREGTLRDWVRKKKAADPNWRPEWEQAPKTVDPADLDPESIAAIEVGGRCEANPGGRRGTVAFAGEVEGLGEGYWVGVRFDEPVGRGDGTVKGVRIFECEERYGGWIRPRNVTVGDFPERDLRDELDDSDDDDEM